MRERIVIETFRRRYKNNKRNLQADFGAAIFLGEKLHVKLEYNPDFGDLAALYYTYKTELYTLSFNLLHTGFALT